MTTRLAGIIPEMNIDPGVKARLKTLSKAVEELQVLVAASSTPSSGIASGSALPTASSSNYLTFFLLQQGGQPEQLHFCQRTSSGSYEWVTVALSSS